MMKKVLSLIALMAAAFTAQAQDGLTWWGNYADEGFAITGNNKVPGDYEAAMFVAGDGTLKGVSIEQIRIQTRLSTSSSKSRSIWQGRGRETRFFSPNCPIRYTAAYARSTAAPAFRVFLKISRTAAAITHSCP